jgi:hypothetical protein
LSRKLSTNQVTPVSHIVPWEEYAYLTSELLTVKEKYAYNQTLGNHIFRLILIQRLPTT